jgi:hypothetical protein
VLGCGLLSSRAPAFGRVRVADGGGSADPEVDDPDVEGALCAPSRRVVVAVDGELFWDMPCAASLPRGSRVLVWAVAAVTLASSTTAAVLNNRVPIIPEFSSGIPPCRHTSAMR